MLVLGHTGITLGVAILLARVVDGSPFSKAIEKETTELSSHSYQVVPTLRKSLSYKASWLNSLATRVDIRLLLIGSIFPDIIDKPVGYFMRETFNSGRIFCHTLLFLILVTVAGLYFYRRQSKTWPLAFSFGTITHLIFDQMWLAPQTLFWPLLGLSFKGTDFSNWIPNILQALLTKPDVYVPELVGAAVLIWFAWLLYRSRKIYSFIKHEKVQLLS